MTEGQPDDERVPPEFLEMLRAAVGDEPRGHVPEAVVERLLAAADAGEYASLVEPTEDDDGNPVGVKRTTGMLVTNRALLTGEFDHDDN